MVLEIGAAFPDQAAGIEEDLARADFRLGEAGFEHGRADQAADADARRAIVGLQPKRAEVILAGACIVRTVMEKLGKESFAVSDRGLRHGVLAERFAA